jgi:hypothetical protein
MIFDDGTNVGIGTATPGAKLDVNGRIRIGSNAQTEIYSTGNRVTFRSENTDACGEFAGYGLFLPRAGQSYNLYIAGSALLGYSDASATLDIARGGSGSPIYIRLNSNGSSYFNGGSVGIGNTSPGHALDVTGIIRAYTNATYNGENGAIIASNAADLNKRVFIGYDGTADIGFIQSVHSGTAYKILTINAAGGNVGIGTTTPQKRLESISNANDFVSVGVQQLSVGQWTGIHFGFREANTSYRKSAIVFERTDLTEGNAQGKVHILNGPQSGGTSATLSDARITISENGNVGIGTTSPLTTLDVNGITRTGGSVFGKSILSVSPGSDTYYKLATLPISTSGTYDHIVIEGVINGTWSASESFPFRILLGNREGATNHFYYGPGTSAGGSNASVVVYLESDNSRTVWLKFNASQYTTISVNVVSSINVTTFPNFPTGTPTGTLNWSSATNTPLTFYEMGNSRFGIGTTAPTEKLHVIGGNIKVNNSYATYYGDSANNNGGRIYCPASSNEFYINQANNASLVLLTNNATRVTILGGGNVGINETSPVRKLEVYNTNEDLHIAAVGSAPSLNLLDANSGPTIAGTIGLATNSNNFIQTSVSGDLCITTRGSSNSTATILFGSGSTMIANIASNGDMYIDGTLTQGSTRNIKENIVPISNALSSVMQIQGVTYDKKDGSTKNEPGFIAEDMYSILPSLVSLNKTGDPQGIKYTNLTAYLVEAIKELKAEIDILKNK